MSGISWKVTVEDDTMRRGLEQLYEQMEDRQGFYGQVGEHLVNKLRARFNREEAPDSSRWQGLAPATIDARIKKNGNTAIAILNDEGDLKESFLKPVINADGVEMGSQLPYAAIHHFGGGAGRNHAVTIPARPILGLEPDDPDEIIEIAEDWLKL